MCFCDFILLFGPIGVQGVYLRVVYATGRENCVGVAAVKATATFHVFVDVFTRGVWRWWAIRGGGGRVLRWYAFWMVANMVEGKFPPCLYVLTC